MDDQPHKPEMPLIHHVVTGRGRAAVVFVHGFGCAHSDWDAQVAHLSPRHQTIAVDLRGHGASPGTAADCTIERYGAYIAEVMQALACLPPCWSATAWDVGSSSKPHCRHQPMSL